MSMKNYDSLVVAMDDLRERGYEADYATDTVCLYCGDLDLRFNHDEFNVDEVYHFEGDSNPDDNATLYAITSSTGVKGMLVDGYGAYNGSLSFEMAKKLQYHAVMSG